MSVDLNKEEIIRFVRAWFARLNEHAPIEKIKSMLSAQGLQMKFPEATLANYEQVEKWYKGVTTKFFDQSHILKNIEIKSNGDEIDISLVVNWRAHAWEPPQASSEWFNFDALQSWTILRDGPGGNYLIKKYIVESLKPNEDNTKEIANKYFEYVNKGEWDSWLGLFADDVIMDEQVLGRIKGKGALSKAIEGLRGNPDFHNFPKEFVVEGDQAVVTCNVKTTLPGDKKIDIRVANYYKIKDGKIAYFANFHDTAPFK
ncbi:MAG: nuclear transport factor 2 family protein, partial [Candidatus Omnitrophica bacterium]|nr:nuclear transport factor 2 family protein [Candidatus Omnitrophota bacterium]